MTNLGGEIKSALTDAEKASRTGLRAFIINNPFLWTGIMAAVGVALTLGAQHFF